MMDRSANSYAKHLASYLSDASTIRVRVLEKFDAHVPSRQAIQKMIDLRKKQAERKR